MPQELYILLNFNFIMIYMIYKISVPLKITLVALNIGFSNAFSRSALDFHFCTKKNIINFLQYVIMKNIKNGKSHI